MTDKKESPIWEGLKELDNLQWPLDELKKELGKSWQEEKALWELEREITDPIRTTLIKLLNKLSGFDVSKIKWNEVEQLSNGLKNMRDIFWTDVVAEVLQNTWGNITYESIRELCDKVNMAELGKDVETGKTVKITATELKELLEFISAKDIKWAVEMLKFQITENVSSSELLRDSDLSKKVDEFLSKQPEDSRQFKDSKDFFNKMDAAWGLYFKNLKSNWSEDTIINMSSWMSFGLMEIFNHYKGESDKGIMTIVWGITKGDFSSLEKSFWKKLWFNENLKSIGTELWFDKSPDESEKYEILNNPAKFSALAKEYITGNMSDEMLKQKIIESRNDNKNYPRITEADKNKIEDISKKFWQSFNEQVFGAATLVPEVAQIVWQEDKGAQKPKLVKVIEAFCNKWKIDWWIKDVILAVIGMFTWIDTQWWDESFDKNEILKAFWTFFSDDNSIKWTIFDWLRQSNPEFETTTSSFDKLEWKSGGVLTKWKKASGEKDRSVFLSKLFNAKGKFIKHTEENVLQDKDWNNIEFLKDEKNSNGKTKRYIDLKNLDMYIHLYDKSYPNEKVF